jgi:hypothetical protein
MYNLYFALPNLFLIIFIYHKNRTFELMNVFIVMDRKEYYKQWREKNKDVVKQKEQERDNSEHRKKWKEKYAKENRERLNELQREWRKNNPERAKQIDKNRNDKPERKESIRINNGVRNKKRRLEDPIFKASENIRRMIQLSFKGNGYTKKSKTYQILGCTVEEFKLHLEKQFKPWMNWGNYGLYNGELNYGWDIDHIIPLATTTNEEELLKLNHFSNLQPLCSKINRDIKKHNLI